MDKIKTTVFENSFQKPQVKNDKIKTTIQAILNATLKRYITRSFSVSKIARVRPIE